MLKAVKNPCKHAQGVVNAAVPDSYCATITITFTEVLINDDDGESYPSREQEEVWEGDFRTPSFAMNGTGKRTIKDDVAGRPGDTIQEGEFKDGELHGQGKITYSNGTTGEGRFEEGTFKEGTIIYGVCGTICTGEFHSFGVLLKGTKTRADGTKCEGTWDLGSRDEDGTWHRRKGGAKFHGKMTFANGTIQEGEFKGEYWAKMELHGQGKITYSDGTGFEGKFVDGKAVSRSATQSARALQAFKDARLRKEKRAQEAAAKKAAAKQRKKARRSPPPAPIGEPVLAGGLSAAAQAAAAQKAAQQKATAAAEEAALLQAQEKKQQKRQKSPTGSAPPSAAAQHRLDQAKKAAKKAKKRK